MKPIAFLTLAVCLPAQQIVTTFAGTDWVFPSNGKALTDAAVSRSLNLAADAQGVIYFADTNNNNVMRLESNGSVTVVAGNGLSGFSGDGGEATRASLRRPFGIALDGAGNLYIGDSGNSRVRRVTPAGIITTVAGNGSSANSGDGGLAVRAGLVPNRITVDRDGVLYITDATNFRIRRVGLDGTISTIAGTGNSVYTGDGRPARDTALAPHAIVLDPTGAIVVSDQRNFRVLRIGADGMFTTIAGTGTRGSTGDGGPARSATITNVDGMTYDRAGNLLLCDASSLRIRQISPSGIIATLAGNGTLPASGSGGVPTRAGIGLPNSAAIDAQGRVVFNDAFNGQLWRIASNASSIQIIGGEQRFKVFPPRSAPGLAWLSEPFAVTTATDGSVFIADTLSNRIHRVAPDGTISHFMGQGAFGCCADGSGLLATRIRSPRGIALDSQNRLVVVDAVNNLIVRTTTNGLVNTIAGTTSASSALGTFGGDNGPATEARLNAPTHVVVDPSGNIIFSDSGNNRVRRISPAGIITTIAGNGTAGFSGDNGPAIDASLSFPVGLAFNAAGELLIADARNHRIRAVSAAGVIRTWAGDGRALSAGDGRGQTEASFLFRMHL